MRLSISQRISLAFGLLLFLFFITSAVTYLLTSRIEQDVSTVAAVDDPRDAAARAVDATLIDLERDLILFSAGDAGRQQSLAASRIALDEATAQLVTLFDETAAATALRDQVVAAQVATEQIISTVVSRGTETGGLPPTLADFTTAADAARAIVRDRLLPSVHVGRRAALDDLATSTEASLIYLLVMTGFGVFVGAGASVLLSNGILRPVQELTEGAEAFGSGQLSHRIDIGSEDEFGRLARSFNRMAESRQRAEEALRQLAHHDPLTKLPNRTLFQIRLVEALENARRTDRMVAVHFLDLDHFKDVNDTLGHPAGDMLLQHVSGRLSECVRRSDTVARLGGDEFAIIQTNLDHQRGIAVLAQRIIESLSKPFDLDGEIVYTGTSVGITVYPQDDSEAEMLIKDADMALYRAKQEGRGKYQLYNPGMNDEVQARKSLEQELRKAIERDEFFLTYQPQIELGDGNVIGAESLIRWQHPEKGLISPGDFIPVAEQAGLITKLTEFVLRESCKQAKAWQDDGLGELRVSVNLSPVDFKRPDLIALMNRVLTEANLEAKYLHLEITEGMVMSGIDSAIETLSALRALGIELSIDDFGTGYSSMNYLKQFPVGGLKIDQSFIRDILVNRQDASITKAIIKVGHSLSLKVIAEGVETREQMDFLRLRACDEVQGYWISRPLSPEQFAEFVSNHEPHSFLHGTSEEADDAAE